MNRRQERLGEILWVLCAQFFVAEHFTSSAWTLPYSFVRNYISDLGAVHCTALICSPLHRVMNASFILQGFLIFGGALCCWPRFQRVGRIGLAFLAISGAGVLLVGIAPSDAQPLIHQIGAAIHFIAAGLAFCLLGAASWLERNARTEAAYSFLTGLVVLAATASLSQALEPAGAIERVAAYSIVSWLIVTPTAFPHPARLRDSNPRLPTAPPLR